MADFQHPLDLPFGNEGYRVVGDETFTAPEAGLDRVALGFRQEKNVYGTAFQGGAAGVTLAQAQAEALESPCAEAAPGGVFQHQSMWVEEQNGRSIHAQLGGYLVQRHAEGNAQVKTACDGQVDVAQGLHEPQPAPRRTSTARSAPVPGAHEKGLAAGQSFFCPVRPGA